MEPFGPTNPGQGYSVSVEPTPMPMMDESWNSTYLQPSGSDPETRRRVVHTQQFEVFTTGEGPDQKTELRISEVDWQGRERLKHPEHFFYGIVGHTKHKWRYPINGWREASRIANYWRRFFNVKEVPYKEYQTKPHQNQADDLDPADEQTAQDDTDGIHPVTENQTPSVPQQISQLAHILYDVMVHDPDINGPILQLLQTPAMDPRESNLRLCTREQLSQLSCHLAITANIMAQPLENAEAEIPDELDCDDVMQRL